jgi:2-amino-4-hydroxy-6-hydroxymethyldihydropteridine diphosphokinase
VFDTRASAGKVLRTLQQLEAELGRLRRRRWDSRSIDLDVVLHGKLVGGATGLVVPHPRYTARRFVLVPACDVASHFRDPRFGWTLGELAAHLDADVPSLALATGRMELRETLCRRLSREHGIAVREFASTGEPVSATGDASPPGPGWVTCHVPPLPSTAGISTHPGFPRLLVRIQHSDPASAWPAPHQMWPAGWNWPEYRLEVDDEDWAVSELASAYDSMRCAVQPVTADGHWW